MTWVELYYLTAIPDDLVSVTRVSFLVEMYKTASYGMETLSWVKVKVQCQLSILVQLN